MRLWLNFARLVEVALDRPLPSVCTVGRHESKIDLNERVIFAERMEELIGKLGGGFGHAICQRYDDRRYFARDVASIQQHTSLEFS